MKIVIVNIGNELLSGKTANTNLTFLGNRLLDFGLEVSMVYVIPDVKESIMSVLDVIWKESVFLLITGGLGPTRDDLTKSSIASFFDKELIFDENIYDAIKSRFAQRKMEMPEANKVQAYVPDGFVGLHNSMGTAPGLFYREDERYLFCLPGVPLEMEHLFEVHVEKFLKERSIVSEYFCRSINTFGVSESKLAEMMKDIACENGVHIAWLPKIGRVDIRVSGKNITGCERVFGEIKILLSDKIWGIDAESPMDLLHEKLCETGMTISTAESCTGGMLASMLTKKHGSSQYYKGSMIAYSNQAKMDLLDVSEESLNKYGAVSEEVVLQMLKGCEEKFYTDIVCAVSGIAGPDGGSDEKPVGTVYVGVKILNKIVLEKCFFAGNRDVVRMKSSEWIVLKILESFLKNEH